MQRDRHREIDPEEWIIQHTYEEAAGDKAYKCAIQAKRHEKNELTPTSFGRGDLSSTPVNNKSASNQN